MIIFILDNRPIDFREIWYHSQNIPKPGDHFYRMEVDLNDKKLIDIFEKMLSKKIFEKEFCAKAIETGKSNSFNLIRWTLDYLGELPNENNEIKWVFNSIKDVRITDKILIIEGIASTALDKYP